MDCAETSTDEPLKAEEVVPAHLRLRANRLARALQKMTLPKSATAAISCCPAHKDDERVATAAATSLGLTALCIPADLGCSPELVSVAVVLACGEGVDRVRGLRGIVVSDVPGAYWWRLLELRESDAPLDEPSPAAAAA
jgi:hypothetical protein